MVNGYDFKLRYSNGEDTFEYDLFQLNDNNQILPAGDATINTLSEETHIKFLFEKPAPITREKLANEMLKDAKDRKRVYYKFYS